MQFTLSLGTLITCEPRRPPSATPKAPPASGRSTTHASPPSPPSPDPAAPSPGAQLLIPPCQPGTSKFLVQVIPIRQDTSATVRLCRSTSRTFTATSFPKARFPVNCLVRVPNGYFISGQSIPTDVVHHANGVAVADGDNLAGEVLK
jgi:hypothetical protein